VQAVFECPAGIQASPAPLQLQLFDMQFDKLLCSGRFRLALLSTLEHSVKTLHSTTDK